MALVIEEQGSSALPGEWAFLVRGENRRGLASVTALIDTGIRCSSRVILLTEVRQLRMIMG